MSHQLFISRLQGALTSLSHSIPALPRPPRPACPDPAAAKQTLNSAILRFPLRVRLHRSRHLQGHKYITMAPPNNQKRVKGVSVFRPFVYGTTARPFDPASNPKPEGVPADHTHSWTVFVKGVDDTDITYWCKKVQFKLHESIPNHIRSMRLFRLRA